jgi:hypothetical protein
MGIGIDSLDSIMLGEAVEGRGIQQHRELPTQRERGREGERERGREGERERGREGERERGREGERWIDRAGRRETPYCTKRQTDSTLELIDRADKSSQAIRSLNTWQQETPHTERGRGIWQLLAV